MVRLFIGLGVVALGLLIYCMVEWFQTPRHRVRTLPKSAWLFIILLLPLLGPGLWMAFGRARATPEAPRRKGPTAPDDDPEFLRRVEIERRQQQRREQEAQQKAHEAKTRREADERRRAKEAEARADEAGSAEADAADPRASAGTDDDSPAPPPEDEDPDPGTDPQRS